MPLPLRAHSATHPGLVHPKNEDAHTVVPTTEGGLLLVVCDGMGGMGRGDEASRLAIDVLSGVMSRGEGLPADRMRQALRAADQRIRDELCGDYEQPGATAVMVYVLDGMAHVAWVGDSRAYLVRDGRVVYRTRDHKLVEELVEAGQLTPEEARESTLAHVVTRALGGRSPSDPPVQPATLGYPWRLRQDDRVLLCSDGVCDLVEDDEISAMIDRSSPAEGTARLVETALLRGGHDNITCIVAVWDGATWVDEEAATPIISPGRLAGPAGIDGFGSPSWDGTDAAGRITEELDRTTLSDEDDRDLGFADLPTAENEQAENEQAGNEEAGNEGAGRRRAERERAEARRVRAETEPTESEDGDRTETWRPTRDPVVPIDRETPVLPARVASGPPPVDVSPGSWMAAGAIVLVLAVIAWVAASL